MKILKIFACFFGIVISSAGQESSVHLITLFQKIDSVCYLNFAETEHYLDSAFQLAVEEKDTAAYIHGLIRKGRCSVFHNPRGASLKPYLEAKKIVNNASMDIDFLKLINSGIGEYYYRVGDLDSAYVVFYEEISRLRNLPELSIEDLDYLGSAYLFVGKIKEKQKAYYEAINYMKYYITLEEERAKKEKRSPSIAPTLGRLGSVYLLKEEFQTAAQYFRIAVEEGIEKLRKKPQRINHIGRYLVGYYQGIGESYLHMNRLDSAIFYLNESLRYPESNLNYHAKTYTLLGDVYGLMNRHDKAVIAHTNAIKHIQDQYADKKHIAVAKTYTSIGDYYAEKQDYDKALSNYQLSIINLVADFDNQIISSNPNLDNMLSEEFLLEVMHKKVNLLYAKWEATKRKSIALDVWNTGMRSIDLLELVKRENFVFEDDLLVLMEQHHGLYDKLVEISFELDKDYSEDIFLLVEKSKTTGLLKSFSSLKANLYASIPADYVREERILNKKINRLKERLYQLQPNNSVDSLTYVQLSNRLFEKEEQRNLIRDNYKSERVIQSLLPNYLDIHAVQTNLLEADKGIIEYFEGESGIYAFLITQDTFQIYRLPEQDNIIHYAASIKGDIFYKRGDEYIEKAYALYQLLIAPLEIDDSIEQLIIVPDGVLHYLPFEVLLEYKPENLNDYKEYSYLIKKYDISYCLSGTLLNSLRTKKHKRKPFSQVLSFAPAFHELEKDISENSLAERNQLTQLIYNDTEIQSINNITNSKLLSGKNANKDEFLNLSSQYKYIHLATHGKVDDTNSSYSYIAFSNLIDTLNQSYKLYTNELNSLQLNSDMVVLSACETGVGKAYKGEGLISLSRGFLAAGAKSVITTLWNINDQMTTKIVASFYNNLREGMNKAEALRQAKLTYLTESDKFEAHPKYWAAFIPVGDMSPLDQAVFLKTDTKKWYWLLALLGLSCMGAFFFLGKKN